MTKYKNIFIIALESLKVKHTKYFANKVFNEHPHKYNLFGLSSMLSNYGLKSVGLKITNKNDIHSIVASAILQTKSCF